MTDFAALHHQEDLLNGYKEQGNNITKIWGDLQPSFQGAPYCAGTVSYIWKHAGRMLPAVDHAWGYSYCPDGVVYAKRNHMWDTSGHYAPGDTVFYDWDGDGIADHTGSVVEDTSIFVIFEGNTSADNVNGSQSNGEGCYYRHRSHGPYVMGVWKTSRYLTGAKEPAGPPVTPKNHTNPFKTPNPPVGPGNTGDGVRYVQWAVAVPVDGVFGNQTGSGVRLFQRYHKDQNGRPLVQDGIVGALTLWALRQVVHH